MRGAGDSNSIKLDAETDLLITRMGEEKAIAEHKEDFDMASALKNIIATTLVVGEQIYQCDMGKVLKVSKSSTKKLKASKSEETSSNSSEIGRLTRSFISLASQLIIFSNELARVKVP